MKTLFTEPTIVRGQKWYVRFLWNGKEIRVKSNLNKLSGDLEKEVAAEVLRVEIFKNLKKGFLPKLRVNHAIPAPPSSSMRLLEGLDLGLEKKKPNLAHKSYLDYKCTVKHVKLAIERLNYKSLMLRDTKKFHVKTILEEVRSFRKWSNGAYNKNLCYLQSVLSELVEWEIIDHNPGHSIKALPVHETEGRHRPPTAAEHKLIKQALSEYPAFGFYVEMEFHTGIRPKEMLEIRIGDIDMINAIVKLKPENTKTNTWRNVALNSYMIDAIRKLEIHKMPKDLYLFGKNSKNQFIKQEDFIPGKYSISRNTATGRWKAIVKDALGINVTMYSYKHYGADMKLLNGVSLEAIGEQMGHTSKFTTKKYLSKLKDVHNKEIRDKSPAF